MADNNKYQRLFEPLNIGNLRLGNRVVMPPMTTGYADNGFVTDTMIDHYAARARGGTGLIIVEDCIVDTPLGKHGLNDIFIDDDKYIPGLQRLAQAIKEAGSIAGIQLNHGGRMAGKIRNGELLITGGEPPVAPSAIAFPAPGFAVPHELTIQEFSDIEDKFAESARRAKEAGFDLVSLHCSHQYLIEQSLSPLSNQRQDIYGGDFDRRLHFLMEIISKTRQKVGDDYAIICRISGIEHTEGGLTVEDAKLIAQRLEEAGIMALNVSHGANPAGLSRNAVKPLTDSPKREQRGELVYLAEPIKKVVSIPVMTVGRIITPGLAEEILEQGKADLICIGRGLLADPEWAEKSREGREKEIRHCIACEHCFSSTQGEPLACSVNPAIGTENESKLEKASRAKKVLIAGGGPAGMETARIAAIRGHDVCIYEKNSLGGQLNLSYLPPGKDEFELFLDFAKEQLDKLGVRIEHNEVNTEVINKENPDAVIVATGALPLKPGLPGIDKDNVLTAWQVLKGNMPRGKKVVVLGGGSTGAETAEMLAVNGNKVTIVEQLSEIAVDTAHLPFYHLALLITLEQLGVEIMTGTTVKEITGNGVTVESSGKTYPIEASVVVLALGVEPDNTLANQLKNMDIELYIAGDCEGIGTLAKAVKEGFEAGLTV